MSNTQYAFLESGSLLDRVALQSWTDGLGFDLKLHPDLNLKFEKGFFPCILKGDDDVGFELSPSTTEEIADGDEEILEMTGARDFCVSMSWGDSMKDCAAVMLVSCVLAQHCDAVISYEGSEPEPLGKLLETTSGILVDVRDET
jgi:hypothetical protein